jgi:hypothetical protein
VRGWNCPEANSRQGATEQGFSFQEWPRVFADAVVRFDGFGTRGYDPLVGIAFEKYYKRLHQRILNNVGNVGYRQVFRC